MNLPNSRETNRRSFQDFPTTQHKFKNEFITPDEQQASNVIGSAPGLSKPDRSNNSEEMRKQEIRLK
jgi:hypothetical protein